MATSVPAGNDLLHQVPGTPIRAGRPPAEAGVDYPAHLVEQNVDLANPSSPQTTPTPPPSHIGADPADAAKGAIA